jgi:hypothetical protein
MQHQPTNPWPQVVAKDAKVVALRQVRGKGAIKGAREDCSMRKRSKYRPGMVITDPLSLLRPASRSARDAVNLTFLTALHELSNGRDPGREEWRSLSDAINTVETLATKCRKLDENDVMPIVNAAIAGMVAASNRFKEGKGMRLDASGLEALREVVSIYGQCMDQLTEREMAVAQAVTQQRVNEIYRSNAKNIQVVCI